MGKGEFWGYYLTNIDIGLMYGALLIVLNFIILKKYIYSVFDPFVYGVVTSSLAYSVVFFLYHMGLISDYYFFSFVLTQTAFFIGFFVFKPINIKKNKETSKVSRLRYSTVAKYLYVLSVLLWIFSQLFVYYKVGIPLFMDSRLETFAGGTGFGIFGRIIPVTSSIAIIIAMYKIFILHSYKSVIHKYFDYFVILFTIIVAFLSGSKGALLGMIFTMFFIILFNYRAFSDKSIIKKIKNIKRKQRIIFLLAIGAAFFTIIVQFTLKYGDKNVNPLIPLMMRFVNTGDVYMYAYPNGFIENMQGGNPILALFKDFFGMLRLISWEELPKHIGLQLYQDMHNTDDIKGPNARHNVFGLHYFGVIGSLILSFLLGMLTSYLRNKLYYKVNISVLGMVTYILLAQKALAFESDPPYIISQYVSIFIVFLPLLFISYLLAIVQKRGGTNYE